MTLGNVCMTIQNSIHSRRSGILQKRANPQFDLMPVTMGHIQAHAANPVYKDFRLSRRTPIAVAVSRHLIKRDFRKRFLQNSPIIKIVPKMNHRIRLDLFNTQAHKTECRMRIRQYKNRHSSPPNSVCVIERNLIRSVLSHYFPKNQKTDTGFYEIISRMPRLSRTEHRKCYKRENGSHFSFSRRIFYCMRLYLSGGILVCSRYRIWAN